MRMIDADALKTELDAWARIIQKPNHYAREDALHIVDSAPTIDAVPVVRGEWKKDSDYPWLLNCSVCGYSTERGTNYCPNCGARMDGES